MDILVKIFTSEATSSSGACHEVEKAFNDFVGIANMGRIVSITTDTTHSKTATATMHSMSVSNWFTYTLTLVYEPGIELAEISTLPGVDSPTKNLF